mgnify:CR=1 FL=1|jgi:Predicted membrane protein
MKIRFFGLVLLLAALSVGQSGAAEEAPSKPATAEESGDGPDTGKDEAAEEESPDKEKPAPPASEEEESPAAPEDPEVQEAIEQAEPPVEPTEGEAEAAGVADSGDQPADAEVIVEETIVEETVEPAPSVDESLGAPLDLDTLPTEEGLDIPNPDELLPDDVYAPEDDEIAPPAPTITESKIDRDRRLAIRYQEVKLLALKDPAIREMREKADVARTDEAKRQALREYYKMLFAKMVSIDPELTKKCELMETAYMRRVSQFRVMPTIPLQPPPTPEPLPGRAESAPASRQDG